MADQGWELTAYAAGLADNTPQYISSFIQRSGSVCSDAHLNLIYCVVS